MSTKVTRSFSPFPQLTLPRFSATIQVMTSVVLFLPQSSTRTMFKCTWTGCHEMTAACDAIERHIRSTHLGYVPPSPPLPSCNIGKCSAVISKTTLLIHTCTTFTKFHTTTAPTAGVPPGAAAFATTTTAAAIRATVFLPTATTTNTFARPAPIIVVIVVVVQFQSVYFFYLIECHFLRDRIVKKERLAFGNYTFEQKSV